MRPTFGGAPALPTTRWTSGEAASQGAASPLCLGQLAAQVDESCGGAWLSACSVGAAGGGRTCRRAGEEVRLRVYGPPVMASRPCLQLRLRLRPTPPRSTFILNRERAVDYLNTLDRLYGEARGAPPPPPHIRGPARQPTAAARCRLRGAAQRAVCVRRPATTPSRQPRSALPTRCAHPAPHRTAPTPPRPHSGPPQCLTATLGGTPRRASRSALCARGPTTPSSCTTCSSGPPRTSCMVRCCVCELLRLCMRGWSRGSVNFATPARPAALAMRRALQGHACCHGGGAQRRHRLCGSPPSPAPPHPNSSPRLWPP